MPVYWLSDDDPYTFPHPSRAEPTGLLAVGGDLSVERLIAAYQLGIFPWFEHEEVLYWFSPNPRAVLFPADLKVHKSMRSIFNQQKFQYTLDTCFERVMEACAETERNGQEKDTWITSSFKEGYTDLYHLGLAHSVEVWIPGTDELVGGLYGVAFGRVFYGESMFARTTNASKAGFITLVRALEKAGFWLIDCQQSTSHLLSLGAQNIPRARFMSILRRNTANPMDAGRWHLDESGNLQVLSILSDTKD